MKICFISNATELGGAERVLLETIDALKDKGIECRVLLPGDGELSRELSLAEIPYSFVDGGSWVTWSRPSPWSRAKAAAKIAFRLLPAVQKIKQWNCDAIYSNTLTACHGSIIAKLLHIPHIWHLHEFGREDHGVFYQFGEKFSNRAIGNLAAACIVVSRALGDKYKQYIPSAQIAVVYPSMHRAQWNSVTSGMEVAPPFNHTRFRLILVGALVQGKGQVDALQGLFHLVRAGLDADLLIVGDGSPAYRGRLQEIARSGGLADRVRFVGNVDNTFPLLQTAHVALVCSRSEAFGRVTIEAMLAGKPVVGAAAGATVELIQHGFNGLLYECGNPADLAAKVRFLADHPTVLRQMGESGRRWAQSRFAKERYGEELMAVLSSVIGAKSIPCQDLANVVTR